MSARSDRRPAWWPTEVEIELLRGVFDEDPAAAVAVWRSLERRGELERLRSDAARLRPLLYERLCAADAAGPDTLPLRRVYAETRSLNSTTRARAREALELLADRGIAPMLLKGLALDSMAGGQGTRRIGDLDLMVRHARLGEALAALRSGGWEPIESTQPGAPNAKHSTCLRRAEAAEVDLHWVLGGRLSASPDPEAAMARFWASARSATYLGVEVWLLHPMHQVLHLLVHGAFVESRAAVRWLADVAFVLRRGVSTEAAEAAHDWPMLIDAARSLCLSLQTWSALRCLEQVFPGTVPAAVLDELQSSPRAFRERLLWLLDSRTVRRPLALDVVRTLRAHLSNQRYRSLPTALLLYPRYLVANGYVVSPLQLARHVVRRRRERRDAARLGA